MKPSGNQYKRCSQRSKSGLNRICQKRTNDRDRGAGNNRPKRSKVCQNEVGVARPMTSRDSRDRRLLQCTSRVMALLGPPARSAIRSRSGIKRTLSPPGQSACRHVASGERRHSAWRRAPKVTEGFSHFVASVTAPVASGWSGCRVGLTPTGKRRLSTPHTRSSHLIDVLRSADRAGRTRITFLGRNFDEGSELPELHRMTSVGRQ